MKQNQYSVLEKWMCIQAIQEGIKSKGIKDSCLSMLLADAN